MKSTSKNNKQKVETSINMLRSKKSLASSTAKSAIKSSRVKINSRIMRNQNSISKWSKIFRKKSC